MVSEAMTHKEYKPFVASSLGNTVSCHTLARMLDDIGDYNLNRKVSAHIARCFRDVRKMSLTIPLPETRKMVGQILLDHVKHFDIDVECPQQVKYVIKNIKYAYIKDMLISDSPMNYQRKLRPGEGSEAILWLPEFEEE